MTNKITFFRISGWLTVICVIFAKPSYEQNVTATSEAIKDISETSTVKGNSSEIDYETLSQLGISQELADEFKVNLIKAIEAAKEQEGDPLRQGEFGGVAGGFYQGGGGQGGGGFGGGPGGGGGGQEEDDYEEDDGPTMPTTPGPGAFGVLSGLFGIFSGLGSLNPTRIAQSTVNFFPPSRRMQAQMIVDSLIGYTPPENRTIRPRPRTRRTTVTPLPVVEMTTELVKEVVAKGNETDAAIIEAKGGEEGNETASKVSVKIQSTTTPEPDFINVHDILNNTTPAPPPTNEDDEMDVVKLEYNGTRPIVNSSSSSYKIKVLPKGVPEEDDNSLTNNNITVTTLPSPTNSPTQA